MMKVLNRFKYTYVYPMSRLFRPDVKVQNGWSGVKGVE